LARQHLDELNLACVVDRVAGNAENEIELLPPVEW
jgi:hypothetical protein